MGSGARNFDQTRFLRFSPHSRKPADNNPAIEEVSKARGKFEREGLERLVPGILDKKPGRLPRGIKIILITRQAEKPNENAGRVPCDFSRDRLRRLAVRKVVTGYASRSLLNTGFKEPAPGALDSRRASGCKRRRNGQFPSLPTREPLAVRSTGRAEQQRGQCGMLGRRLDEAGTGSRRNPARGLRRVPPRAAGIRTALRYAESRT